MGGAGGGGGSDWTPEACSAGGLWIRQGKRLGVEEGWKKKWNEEELIEGGNEIEWERTRSQGLRKIIEGGNEPSEPLACDSSLA